MIHTILLVTVSPFVNLVLLVTAGAGARWLSVRIPEGRLKRILYFKL